MLHLRYTAAPLGLTAIAAAVCSEGSEQVPAQGSGHQQHRHNDQGQRAGQNQLDVDHLDEAAENLLYNNVGGQEEGDGDGHGEEDVCPALLGVGGHEGLVVDAEQQADGEEGKKAAVEDLCDQDYHGPVS